MSVSALRYRVQVDVSDKEGQPRQIITLTGPNKRVLEVGPATGYITEVLQQRGCRVTAIEKDPAAAEIAARFCDRMIVGDVEEIDFSTTFPDEPFDVVVFGEVLEHLVDPHRALIEAAKVLRPGGYVVASVPNVAHGSMRLALMCGAFPYTEMGLLDHTHLRFFTRKTLARLFQQAGYVIRAWRRVTADPFATELKLREGDYPPHLVASLRQDTEAMTYQFVVKAVPVARHAAAKEWTPAERPRIWPAGEPFKALWRLEEDLARDNAELAQKAAALAERDALLIERDRHLVTKDAALAEKDAILAEKETHIADIESALHNANAQTSAALQQIGQIRNSTGYRLLERVRRPIRWLFPRGSWRALPYLAFLGLGRFLLAAPQPGPHVGRPRRAFRLAARSLHIIRSEGLRSFLSKAKRRLTAVYGDGSQYGDPELVTELRPLTLPHPQQPKVSIIIPVHNRSLYTYNCLLSLLRNTDGVASEVIVVDDASTDDTQAMLQLVENVRVVKNPKNLGFTQSCNSGAAAASGQHLLFLNNDTKVHEGWLTALVETIERDDSVGLVGAKLVYPNGELQEAGAIIWKDGSGWNYGRHDDPEKPEFNYVREVDYCSGACILVQRDLFERAGGFDCRYAPAYYEDADLAFTIRQMGYKVVYQPKAVVTHLEGVTAGTDTSSGTKRYQEINRAKFLEKWREVLEQHHLPDARDLLLARDRRNGARALVIDHHLPTYDRDSGSLRMYQILKFLVEFGFVVTFIPDNLARTAPYTLELQQMGIETLYGPKDIAEHIEGLGRHLSLCILSRPDVAEKHLRLVRRLAPEATLFYDTVDLHFLRELRRAEVEKSESTRKAAQRYRTLELGLVRACDATITVTEMEKGLLEKEVPGATVRVIPNIHEVRRCGKPFAERQGLLFVGSFMHPPNRDAATYLVRDIFPLIKREIPEVTCYIVGSDPTDDVNALACHDVIVTGWVPDLAPYLESCRVFVAPLRYGAGLKGKIGQSMGFGLPVVTTSIGGEGMDIVDGTEMLIADAPDAFARKVIQAYRDEEFWIRISESSLSYVEDHYSPEVVKAKLRTILSGHGP